MVKLLQGRLALGTVIGDAAAERVEPLCAAYGSCGGCAWQHLSYGAQLEAKRGLVAAAGGVMMLPDQIPERVAMELALTGDFIGADRAYELGLINRVTDGSALDGAKALAASIAANGPLAVKVSKQIMKESRGWAMDERYDKQAQLIGPVFVSEDAREGAAAFAEKRKPNWKGK